MITGRLCDLYARYGRALIGVTFRSERSGFVYILKEVDEERKIFYVDHTEDDSDLNYVSSDLFVTLIYFGTPWIRVRNAAILLGWLRNKRC